MSLSYAAAHLSLPFCVSLKHAPMSVSLNCVRLKHAPMFVSLNHGHVLEPESCTLSSKPEKT